MGGKTLMLKQRAQATAPEARGGWVSIQINKNMCELNTGRKDLRFYFGHGFKFK